MRPDPSWTSLGVPAPSPRNSRVRRLPWVTDGQPETGSNQEERVKPQVGSKADGESRDSSWLMDIWAREGPRPSTSTGGDSTL